MGEDCAVLVCSCDKNEDLWKMFFYYMKQYWKDCGYPIYLNTESRKYVDSWFEVKTFGLFPNGDKDRWSYRLRKTLEQMKENYVLILLEDFFLRQKVDRDEISLCLKRMKENDNIAVFLFDPTPGPNTVSEYDRYEKKAKKAPFRMSLQAGLWNKKHLLHFIRDHENPWQFESWGSIRSRRYKQDFYALKEGAPRVFTYPSGGVLADNRWHCKAACRFIEEDWGIDLEATRGVYERGDPRKTELRHRSFARKCIEVCRSLI